MTLALDGLVFNLNFARLPIQLKKTTRVPLDVGPDGQELNDDRLPVSISIENSSPTSGP